MGNNDYTVPPAFPEVAPSIGIWKVPECSICCCPLLSDLCTVRPCAHVFHLNCAQKWLISKKDNCPCPLCRVLWNASDLCPLTFSVERVNAFSDLENVGCKLETEWSKELKKALSATREELVNCRELLRQNEEKIEQLTKNEVAALDDAKLLEQNLTKVEKLLERSKNDYQTLKRHHANLRAKFKEAEGKVTLVRYLQDSNSADEDFQEVLRCYQTAQDKKSYLVSLHNLLTEERRAFSLAERSKEKWRLSCAEFKTANTNLVVRLAETAEEVERLVEENRKLKEIAARKAAARRGRKQRDRAHPRSRQVTGNNTSPDNCKIPTDYLGPQPPDAVNVSTKLGSTNAVDIPEVLEDAPSRSTVGVDCSSSSSSSGAVASNGVVASCSDFRCPKRRKISLSSAYGTSTSAQTTGSFSQGPNSDNRFVTSDDRLGSNSSTDNQESVPPQVPVAGHSYHRSSRGFSLIRQASEEAAAKVGGGALLWNSNKATAYQSRKSAVKRSRVLQSEQLYHSTLSPPNGIESPKRDLSQIASPRRSHRTSSSSCSSEQFVDKIVVSSISGYSSPTARVYSEGPTHFQSSTLEQAVLDAPPLGPEGLQVALEVTRRSECPVSGRWSFPEHYDHSAVEQVGESYEIDRIRLSEDEREDDCLDETTVHNDVSCKESKSQHQGRTASPCFRLSEPILELANRQFVEHDFSAKNDITAARDRPADYTAGEKSVCAQDDLTSGHKLRTSDQQPRGEGTACLSLLLDTGMQSMQNSSKDLSTSTLVGTPPYVLPSWQSGDLREECDEHLAAHGASSQPKSDICERLVSVATSKACLSPDKRDYCGATDSLEFIVDCSGNNDISKPVERDATFTNVISSSKPESFQFINEPEPSNNRGNSLSCSEAEGIGLAEIGEHHCNWRLSNALIGDDCDLNRRSPTVVAIDEPRSPTTDLDVDEEINVQNRRPPYVFSPSIAKKSDPQFLSEKFSKTKTTGLKQTAETKSHAGTMISIPDSLREEALPRKPNHHTAPKSRVNSTTSIEPVAPMEPVVGSSQTNMSTRRYRDIRCNISNPHLQANVAGVENVVTLRERIRLRRGDSHRVEADRLLDSRSDSCVGSVIENEAPCERALGNCCSDEICDTNGGKDKIIINPFDALRISKRRQQLRAQIKGTGTCPRGSAASLAADQPQPRLKLFGSKVNSSSRNNHRQTPTLNRPPGKAENFSIAADATTTSSSSSGRNITSAIAWTASLQPSLRRNAKATTTTSRKLPNLTSWISSGTSESPTGI